MKNYLKISSKTSWAFIFFLSLIFFTFLTSPSEAKNDNSALKKILLERDDLTKSFSFGEKRKRFEWQKVIRSLEESAEKNPNATLAPEALWSAADLSLRSGKTFGIESDLKNAHRIARLFVKRYPNNTYAPRCQIIIGESLIKLNRLEEAYSQLLKVEVNYPKASLGEQNETRKLLTSLRPGGSPPPNLEDKTTQKTSNKEASPNKKTTETSLANKIDPPSPPKPLNSGKGQVYFLSQDSESNSQAVIVYVDQKVPIIYNILEPTKKGGAYRIYVNLQNSELQAGSKVLKREITLGSNLANKAKLSQYQPDIARLVIDLPQKLAYQPQIFENPSRLIVAIAPKESDLDGILKKAELVSQRGKVKTASAPSSDSSTKQAKNTVENKESKPVILSPKGAQESLARQLGLGIKKIVIDAGHGGKDAGSQVGNLKEKDITLKAARILAEKLRSRLGVTVVLTRNSDVFLSLEKRTKIANEAKADLFISLHVNAHSSSKINGYEIYFLNLTADKGAAAVAARENASSGKSISDLSDIINSIMKNTKIAESKMFAQNTQTASVKSLQKNKYQVKDLGVKQAPFFVLLGAKMPAILIEIGFITNPEEKKRLTQDAYLDKVTDGICQGVLNYQSELNGQK